MKIALLFSLILKVSSGAGFTGLDFKLRSNLFLYLNSVAQAKAWYELPRIYLWSSPLSSPVLCVKTRNSKNLIQSEQPVLFSNASVVSRGKLSVRRCIALHRLGINAGLLSQSSVAVFTDTILVTSKGEVLLTCAAKPADTTFYFLPLYRFMTRRFILTPQIITSSLYHFSFRPY